MAGKQLIQSSDHGCDEKTDVNCYEYLSEMSEQRIYIIDVFSAHKIGMIIVISSCTFFNLELLALK